MYCEMLKYNRSARIITVFDEAYCELKGEKRYGGSMICEKFQLRSGMHTTKSYPKKPDE